MDHNFFTPVHTSLRRALIQLLHILKKAEAYAETMEISETILTDDRLYPNMFPLTRQVYIACDVLKGGLARLAGVEAPSFPDTEVTFEELQQRVQKTIDYLDTFHDAQFNGSEQRPIKLELKTRTLEFVGQDYVYNFVIPNVYFHITTCYNILRHNGVPLGKNDFLGEL
jgi:hypothetical protein